MRRHRRTGIITTWATPTPCTYFIWYTEYDFWWRCLAISMCTSCNGWVWLERKCKHMMNHTSVALSKIIRRELPTNGLLFYFFMRRGVYILFIKSFSCLVPMNEVSDAETPDGLLAIAKSHRGACPGPHSLTLLHSLFELCNLAVIHLVLGAIEVSA